MVLTAAQAQARATRVGASEVAALVGEHPYLTPLEVYQRLVEGHQVEVNQAMRVGSLLEGPVLMLARRLEGLRSLACTRAYVHPSLPLSASPDAYAFPHRGHPKGLVEVKVTYAWAELPAYVYWQAQTQLLLTHRPVCWVVALTGSRLTTVLVEADPADQDRIEAAVEAFERDHLVPRIPPAGPERPAHVFGGQQR
jgi:hypothetical protein